MEKFEERLKRWHSGKLSGPDAGQFWAIRSGSSAAVGGAKGRTGWTA